MLHALFVGMIVTAAAGAVVGGGLLTYLAVDFVRWLERSRDA